MSRDIPLLEDLRAAQTSRQTLPATGRILGMLLGLLLLGACAATAPDVRYFRVAVPPLAPSTGPPLALTLGIARLSAPEPYRDERIIYRSSPYRVQYYPDDRWESQPAEMVSEVVLEQFSGSGLFRRVIPWRRGEADYRLEARLRRFEELDEGQTWFGLVELEYEVTDGDGRSLLREMSSQRVQAERRTVEGVVEALSRSLQATLGEAVTKTAAALRSARP
jgi:ABC-type uncharacterized transport system auxiliary subunit